MYFLGNRRSIGVIAKLEGEIPDKLSEILFSCKLNGDFPVTDLCRIC